MSGEGSLCARVEAGIGMDEKSSGVNGELASEPWSDMREGVRRMLCEGDSGDVDGWIVGRR